MNQPALILAEPIAPTGPTIRRGRSRQDYGTPVEFLAAVEARFGAIAFDLAASAENAKASRFFSQEQDSLLQDWGSPEGTLWLNPPFDDIRPWAAKCESVRHRAGWTLLLVPASIGTDWFANHVHGKAYVEGLSPRMSFDGISPYPKDLLLAAFGFGVAGFGTWRWRP